MDLIDVIRQELLERGCNCNRVVRYDYSEPFKQFTVFDKTSVFALAHITTISNKPDSLCVIVPAPTSSGGHATDIDLSDPDSIAILFDKVGVAP